MGLLLTLTGASLFIGFLTPVAGVLVTLGTLGIAIEWLPVCSPQLFEKGLSTIFAVAMAITVVFVGPGAFSLDSRLFGRREIIIPPSPRSPKNYHH